MADDLFDRWFDPSAPAYVIAEAGVNHNGDTEIARQLIDVAAMSGADAVKFQTFKAKKLVSQSAQKADYQKRTPLGEDGGQLAMLQALELADEEFAELKRYSTSKGVTFLSTPFDEESCAFLDRIEVDCFKVSSGDLTHLEFLQSIARYGRPMIVSTGMAELGEVLEAVDAIRVAGDPPLGLLHCVSNYPAAASDCNLRAMATIKAATGCPVGWSDHTNSIAVSLAAVALGARIIEKHFTLSRNLPGPDHSASIEPEELTTLVSAVRDVEKSLGSDRKEPVAAEMPMRDVARRSLVAESAIPTGAVLTSAMISVKRPGTGIAPKFRDLVIGRKAVSDISEGEVITWPALSQSE